MSRAVDNWNSRYQCYAAANACESCELMLEVDHVRWPGGVMAGFVQWNYAHIIVFARQQGFDQRPAYSLKGVPGRLCGGLDLFMASRWQQYDRWLIVRYLGQWAKEPNA